MFYSTKQAHCTKCEVTSSGSCVLSNSFDLLSVHALHMIVHKPQCAFSLMGGSDSCEGQLKSRLDATLDWMGRDDAILR